MKLSVASVILMSVANAAPGAFAFVTPLASSLPSSSSAPRTMTRTISKSASGPSSSRPIHKHHNHWRLNVASRPTSRAEESSTPSFLPEGILSSLTNMNANSQDLSGTLQSRSTDVNMEETTREYQRGLATIAFITFLFSSNSPVLHAAFVNASNPPPVLLLNAATSTIALICLITFGPILNSFVPLPKSLQESQAQSLNNPEHEQTLINLKAGTELGMWKTLGTTANLYGLSLTTANHAAFLIQLTTLIVPAVQGAMGIPIPTRIWTAIGLALAGIALFTQDVAGGGGSGSGAELWMNANVLGDALCAVAAGFYATYDLRLFDLGKKVPPLPLIRTKIAVQAVLSCALLGFGDYLGQDGAGLEATLSYIQNLLSNPDDALLIGSAALWSGFAINAVAPFLQVGGQQTIGASRAQVLYASQPLWASILSWVLLNETLGEKGMAGGSLFLIAIFFAATAESPDPNCGQDDCEVYE